MTRPAGSVKARREEPVRYARACLPGFFRFPLGFRGHRSMADSAAEHGSPAAHDVGHGHSLPRPFARLRQLLQPERRDITTVIVFAVAVAVLSLATPVAVESLVNTVA